MKILKITRGFVTNSSSFNAPIILGVKKEAEFSDLLGSVSRDRFLALYQDYCETRGIYNADQLDLEQFINNVSKTVKRCRIVKYPEDGLFKKRMDRNRVEEVIIPRDFWEKYKISAITIRAYNAHCEFFECAFFEEYFIKDNGQRALYEFGTDLIILNEPKWDFANF